VSATRTLAEYAVGGDFRDLPNEVVAHTKTAILNSLGAAFGGLHTRVGDFNPAGAVVEAVEHLDELNDVSGLTTLFGSP